MSEERSGPISGGVPVLVMPFDEDGAIDDDSLRREIDFCLEAAVPAIAFGWGSESHTLTDAERQHVWSLAARHVDGRVPVVAASTHASREAIIALTRLAYEGGADSAMVDPEQLGPGKLVGLFRDLAERVPIPLVIQDAGGNASVEELLEATEEPSRVLSLKIESVGAPHKIGLVVEGLRERGLAGGGKREVTVLGGSGGRFLLEELHRGSVGTLPFPALIDVFGAVCDLHAAGDVASARATYFRVVLPLSRWAGAGRGIQGGGMWLHKAMFQRAGIVRTTYCRAQSGPLHDWAMEKVWEHLEAADTLISRRIRAHR